MRIIVVGAGGDIGRAVCAELGGRHDLVTAGRSTGGIRVDMADPADVARMYERAGRVDAVVSTAGDVHFGPLEAHTHETLMMACATRGWVDQPGACRPGPGLRGRVVHPHERGA